MMKNNNSDKGIPERELVNMNQNLNLLRSQVQSGHIDATFLTRQIDKIGEMLTRVFGGAQKKAPEAPPPAAPTPAPVPADARLAADGGWSYSDSSTRVEPSGAIRAPWCLDSAAFTIRPT